MAHLVVKLDPEHFFVHALTRPLTNVGRAGWARDVHCSIPHDSVAELHASVEAIEGGYQVVDRSGGRTFLEDRQVRTVSLRDLSLLKFGDVHVTFHEQDAPGAGARTVADLAKPRVLPERLWLRARRLDGAGPEQQVELGDELLLGSSAECGLRLADPRVSARHARLRREPARLVLEDLGSTNGTFAGGQQIFACPLLPGALVHIGPFELRVAEKAEARAPALADFEGILSADPAMKRVFSLVARFAESESPVVVIAETGAGKEGVARAVHARSPRAKGPFVAVNCAALPKQLFESELFGHAKGAFTGAVSAATGLFERADGGTLFLDEVGELPLELQPKLLRALQEGEFRPVGSPVTKKADVRVVAATNRELWQEVKAGRFRSDLYYRLAVAILTLPPLRERREDIPLLFEHFLRLARGNVVAPALGDGARARLLAHPWPGNVRELQNVAERASIFAGKARVLLPEQLRFDEEQGPPAPRTPNESGAETVDPTGKTLEACEREVVAIVVRQHGGNRTTAAAQLEISPVTLRKKLGPS